MRLGFLALVVLLAGCGSNGTSPSDQSLSGKPAAIRVTSSDFIHNGKLPTKYTCDGEGTEPLVYGGTVPVGTSEIVLVVSDADAPGGTFVHLTRFGIKTRGNGALDKGDEGTNSAGKIGWTPPCPPKGDGRHTYVWTVYALKDKSGLKEGASPSEVTAALQHVLGKGSISAFYSR